MDVICYKCYGDSRLLSVNTVGTYWMCADCIREEEQQTGKKGVFFYSCGLDFLLPEEYARLHQHGERPERCK